MSNGDRTVYALLLENALLSHTGQAFEDFFVQAGTAIWEGDFVPWRPQGPLGDFKCDGYRSSNRTVFQCHAPENPEPSRIVAKIDEDFAGARDHFGDKMQWWIFVHNQRKGLPATAAMLIADLQRGNPAINIESWTPNHLINQLLGLPDEKLGLLFPHVPRGQQLSAAVWQALDKVVADNKPFIAEQIGPDHLVNRLALDDALAELDQADREVRRRVLGYSRWLDPAEKVTVIGKLVARGYAQAAVEANALRLQEAHLIHITENHYLPENMQVCQEAAESLMDEFLRELEE